MNKNNNKKKNAPKKKKRLVNVMRSRNKRAPFMDTYGNTTESTGFGHSRGK
jgi:hypothetical protein